MPDPVALGVTDLSFHRVTASLVAHVIEDMGVEVKRVYAHHETNFQRLKTGETDLLCSAWLPSSHGGYKEDVETEVPLLELGLHYEPYALWGVPDYVPTQAVVAVSDLLKPDVVEKMRPDIQGINAGAGITRFSIKMMDEYGLSDAGYRFHTGTEEDCFGTFEAAVKNREWVVVPLWKPQFLHYKIPIRELTEEKSLLGTVDRAVLLLREDRSSVFTAQQLATLDDLRFGNDVIAELDYLVCREGKDMDTATRKWLNQNA